MAELYANNFSTTLAIGCAPADTVIHVAGPASDALQGGQFRILVDGEYMLVTGGQSTTAWNVTRGAGTGESPIPVPGTHFAGVYVTHLLTAAGITNLSGAVTSIAGKTGAVTLASTDLTDSSGLERGAHKDQASGYAGLDAGGLLKAAELPARLVLGLSDLGNVTTTATLDMAGSIARAFTFVLTAPSCALTVLNAVAGSQLDVIPFQDASPPRVITHDPTIVAWTSTGAPTLSSNANAPDRFTYLVLAVDGSGNPTRIVGSLGFTSGAAPQPIDPPVIT